jgi:SAM-dependent MidA family methyltransferase
MSSYHPSEEALVQLPQPAPAEIKHSEALVELVISEIEKHEGRISFRDYMNLLLYAPALGYYSGGLAKIGREGDFVTSPEISPLFGRTIANQCQNLFDQDCGRKILEFGAGSGKLCEQIMCNAGNLDSYLILELSADLRSRQQQYLKQVLPSEKFDRVSWLDSLPDQFSGIVLANEVLDAMPVNLVKKNKGWFELGVGFDGDRFVWHYLPGASEAVSAAENLEKKFGPYVDGYTTEINLNYSPWFKALGDCTDQVVALLIDYGYECADYYHPQRHRGTLLCHYRHRVHSDPLILPGLQDITASVDFDAVADAAESAGFDVGGLVSQGRFLLANDLLEEAAINDRRDNTRAQLDLAQQIKTLSLPDEMGEKFKVIALIKNLDIELPAFRRI